MAYEELLEFSGGRSPWQQDVLRRLALYGALTANDLEELQLQIEQAAGFPVEGVPDPVPLAVDHLSHAASNDPKTVLASLGPVRHVDRLSSDQPPLRFAVNGVTIVYGTNASGKSGYCRIARRLCRSLTSVDLRGNVYDADAPDLPEVRVAFRVGGDDQQKEERVWSGNQDPPVELSRISVFDAATARVYVDEQRRIEFLPYELDLLNKLGLACRALDRGFRARMAILGARLNAPLPAGYREGTAVHAMLGLLVPETDLTDLPSERDLRALGTWSANDQTELDSIQEQLMRDPQVLIRLRTDAKQALDIVKHDVTRIEDGLADAAIATTRRAKQEADTTRRAAEAAARSLFSGQPIPDLGSETWRQILTYARDFAATTFPDAPPPQLASSGLCVLCHQALDEPAAARLVAFDDYISGRATEESVAAARVFSEHQASLMAVRVRSRREVETLLAGYTERSVRGRDSVARISAFFDNAEQRLGAVTRAIREDRYDSLDALDSMSPSPGRFIEDEIARLDAEIAELERVERDELALVRLQARLADLADRKRMSEDLEAIVERRTRLEERYRLDACIRQCRLTAITRRITDRRREVLTPTLRARLHRELERLQLTHLPLDLSDRGEEAQSTVEIDLNAPQRIRNNSEVLSEGEQRGLALACFLAELHELGSDHGIIVDDPVSSLDHTRMKAVAERLAEEASIGRQVIVFTHNIVFHHLLWTAARRARVGRHREWMSNAGNDRFGLIDASHQPWQLKRVPQRLHEIGEEFASLTAGGYDHTDQDFRLAVIGLYTKMRSTWERVVEEVLFNNVVQRFRGEVLTQSLRAAFFDPAADYPVTFEGMKRCSHYSGHEPAPDLPPELPEPGEVARDIEDLGFFVATGIARRKQLEKAPSPEDGVEPILL